MIPRVLRALLCALALPATANALAAAPVVNWPAGWQPEEVTVDAHAAASSLSRQRAVKYDATGTPVMVMELTMTEVAPDHVVNVQGVLLEMRKRVQKDFSAGGYQSVCNRIHPSKLAQLTAFETTCTVTRNGEHVLSQTLVTAVDARRAFVFSYAGQAAEFSLNQAQILATRNSLQL
ncbi:DUF4946 domain-containing protein [Pseudomonas sp. Irchel 3E20]|uniref:DUF4946 domain-containing protein n=1 Tax=Pseudomonas sp. Irchel 3E20 TaxID=2008983 RepID=UPI000BA488DC|nr:DUF4946 domain-containing protein [Pseudomonas sp. Irchel 3E20]